MDIQKVQKEIAALGADAWLISDYENKNPTITSLLGKKMLTRKLFMVIPKEKKPYLICHLIDSVFLSDKETKKNFDLRIYKTWQEMLTLEEESFKDYQTVLMDVSSKGLLPRISFADYGTVSFIASLGKQIISSGDLLQSFSAVYSERSYKLQLQADELALKIKDEAFKKIRDDIKAKNESDELAVQQFIVKRFLECGMVFDEAPIVAIGKNASDPHYGPTIENHSPIHKDDLVLIDMWAKMDDKDAVYADITWMGYVGESVPEIYAERFSVLEKSIDTVLAFLQKELPLRRVEGYEGDRVTRDFIEKAGYGEFFIHRTGHNIAVDVSPHGPGVNLDDYESHDERELIDGVCFSIEPGIYAPDFGMRSETNVYIKERRPLVVAGRQRKIIPILAIKD